MWDSMSQANLRGQTGVNPTVRSIPRRRNLTSVGGLSFALGQPTCRRRYPSLLTAAQITTLTPVSAVTGNAPIPKRQKTIGVTRTADGSGNSPMKSPLAH